MVSTLQQQLAAIAVQKSALIAQQAEVIAAGQGPTYSISSPDGSKSVGMLEYVRFLGDQVKLYVDLVNELLKTLQNLQPFSVNLRIRVRGPFSGGCAGYGFGGFPYGPLHLW